LVQEGLKFTLDLIDVLVAGVKALIQARLWLRNVLIAASSLLPHDHGFELGDHISDLAREQATLILVSQQAPEPRRLEVLDFVSQA
jgi:hypothetical protein